MKLAYDFKVLDATCTDCGAPSDHELMFDPKFFAIVPPPLKLDEEWPADREVTKVQLRPRETFYLSEDRDQHAYLKPGESWKQKFFQLQAAADESEELLRSVNDDLEETNLRLHERVEELESARPSSSLAAQMRALLAEHGV